jgi:hypothetical protein
MSNDEELIRRMRLELDRLAEGVPAAPPQKAPAAISSPGSPPSRRWVALAAAAAAVVVLVAGLVVVAGRDDDAAPSDTLPAVTTPSDTSPSDTTPGVTPPGSSIPGTTEPAPSTTIDVVVDEPQEYETIGTVIDDGTGARLCFDVLESLPPQCGTGVTLIDWSWDAIDVERVEGGTTWVDSIYARGHFDRQANTFTAIEVRPVTDDDVERLAIGTEPDFSVPCAEPEGGWPARNQEWPGDEVSAIDGYAGAWVDESQQVMTVKFVGDLAVAETALREIYSDAVCVVAAEHTAAELADIQGQLMAISSIQFLSIGTYVDATGEWVEARTFAPEPERQAAFDEQFGPGVVRLVSQLHPVS